MGDGVWFHLVESVIRIVIFLAYLWSISLMSDIRRVFQYHGAEHKTIAAWEHGEVLEPRTSTATRPCTCAAGPTS
jgi:uncharacterized protein YqhQ